MFGFLAWLFGLAQIAKNSLAAITMSFVCKHTFWMHLFSFFQSQAALFANWLAATSLLTWL